MKIIQYLHGTDKWKTLLISNTTKYSKFLFLIDIIQVHLLALSLYFFLKTAGDSRLTLTKTTNVYHRDGPQYLKYSLCSTFEIQVKFSLSKFSKVKNQ